MTDLRQAVSNLIWERDANDFIGNDELTDAILAVVKEHLTPQAALLPSLPDGFVAVPLEPTEAMKRAGGNALGGWVAPAMHPDHAYRAMLAARPTPPTASGWQPAETAPRESRKQFLAWGPEISGDGFIVAHWNSGAWWSPAYHTMLDFTHWTPLPSPPEPLETER